MRDYFNRLNLTAVVSCVELMLMKESNTKYHLVVAKLRAYDETIRDSINRTDHLKGTLKEVYKNDYLRIVNDIKECVGDLIEEKDVAEFFEALES